MPNNTMRALITCEVSNEFISALETRGIEYELTGWGQTGNTLTQEELIAKAQDCEIVIVEIEDLNKAVIESLPDLLYSNPEILVRSVIQNPPEILRWSLGREEKQRRRF